MCPSGLFYGCARTCEWWPNATVVFAESVIKELATKHPNRHTSVPATRSNLAELHRLGSPFIPIAESKLSVTVTVVWRRRAAHVPSAWEDGIKSARMAGAKNFPYLVYHPMTKQSRIVCPNDRSPEPNSPKSPNGPPAMAFCCIFYRCVHLGRWVYEFGLSRSHRNGGCPAPGIC